MRSVADLGALRDAILTARSGDGGERLMSDIAGILSAAGVPLWRASTATHVIHPELLGHQLYWVRGVGATSRPRDPGILGTATWVGTPVEKVVTLGHDEIRQRLEIPPQSMPYRVLDELREQGATDYFILGLDVSEALAAGSENPFYRRTWISFATDAAGGFRDEHLDILRSLRVALAARLSLEASRSSGLAIMNAYLGANAARRILSGGWRRGTGEPLRAVVWFCDMRGFTTFSDARPAREVVETLDAYFDAVASPVDKHGGEVLKFIGDAVLGVFPIASDPAPACLAAMSAARDACANLAALNTKRASAKLPPLGAGIAMHTGEVMYGNIGAQNRLDFTVIGAPVNEVCRVEPLTRTLGVDVLLTAAFVREAGLLGAPSFGMHALKGVGSELEVFGLPPA